MLLPTWYEAGEVGLNGLELVDVVLPLLVGDFPGVVVGAGLSLDLVGGRCRGHRSYRCVFLNKRKKGTFTCLGKQFIQFIPKSRENQSQFLKSIPSGLNWPNTFSSYQKVFSLFWGRTQGIVL